MARKKAQREEEQKLLESQGLVTKKRRAPRSRKQNAAVGGQCSTSTNQPAASFGEALEKIVQEKKLSSKINYDVLKALSDDTTPKT
uniref:Brf1 TBP-binding domain-containing protein n=1 Tax=Romanomermis culicivorax TaxID=13658 RepID=A0A915ISK2_ROMCU